jgi:butyryl-CoA dehydrogenase
MSEHIVELKNQVRKFCRDHIDPVMEHDDAESKFRMEIFQGLGNLGLCGIPLPEKYGGADLSYAEYVAILEEIAGSSVAYAVTLSVSVMVQSILNEHGTAEQKEKYLPALTSGQEIGAFALSESHAGSDASALKTTAKKTDGGYILNGSKMWITSGGIAKTYIVMARTGTEDSKGISAFIVRDGSTGFSYGKAEKKMGWKISPTRELIFQNCFVPEENLLGAVGKGLSVAMSGLDRGRISIGAIGVGLAERALSVAIKYAIERVQFKQPIFEFQGLQFMLADMGVEVEASRFLVREAARLYDDKKPSIKLSSMAKIKATDTAMKVTTDAVQVLGGVGYTTEYPVERMMRDAKVLQIVEGTNQIQKIVIAREYKKEFQA